jgi:hypothetical protein
MFDPSKLNLDLDNLDNINLDKQQDKKDNQSNEKLDVFM